MSFSEVLSSQLTVSKGRGECTKSKFFNLNVELDAGSERRDDLPDAFHSSWNIIYINLILDINLKLHILFIRYLELKVAQFFNKGVKLCRLLG